MKLRTVSIAVALLGLAAAGAYVAQRPAKPVNADPRVGAELVAADLLGKVAELRLSDQGKSLLVKRSAEGLWTVPAYYDFPADFQKLNQLVDGLARAKVDRFVTANPERLSRFEFKDTRVALADASGKELFSLTLGKNTEGGGRLLRFGEEARAYQARLGLNLDTEAKNWADSALVGLKPEEVASIEIAFPGAIPVLASRAKKDEPMTCAATPAGQRLRTERIASLLQSLGSIRFSDTKDALDPEAAAARALARSVTLTTFDGRKLVVSLGRKPEQKIPKPATPSGDAEAKPEGEAAPAAPAFETIPAGPVFAFVHDSKSDALINALMAKRSFQVYEYAFTGLPASPADLFEAVPQQPAPVADTPAAPPTGQP